MKDLLLAAGWAAALAGGWGGVVLLKGAGVPRTYARDILHVGAGVWVAGWPEWTGWPVPVLIAWTAAAALALLPFAASRVRFLRRVVESVSGEDERWTGILTYGGSFATLTTLALAAGFLLPAAFAAAALSLGDGLGGLVGRRFGRIRYRLPWSKAKTVEGTLAVAVFSAVGIVLATWAVSAPLRLIPSVVLGGVSATAEALAPRAWDNFWVPAAVFAAALMMG